MKLFSISAILAAALLVIAPVHAQQTSTHEQHQQATSQKSGMMDHDKMMADMKAADARLEHLAQKMNSAQGEEKVRAIQDVVNELVKNQLDMHRHMQTMMNEHMMSQTPRK